MAITPERIVRPLVRLAILLVAVLLALSAWGAGKWVYTLPSLPELLCAPWFTWSEHGWENRPKDRHTISHRELPAHVWQTFVATEDRALFERWPCEGSPLVSRIADYGVHHPSRSFRDIDHARLSSRIACGLTSEEILDLYLNVIYLDDGVFGIEEASWQHFGIPPRALDAGQAALLAGMAQRRRCSPCPNPLAARKCRSLQLEILFDEGIIDEQERDIAEASPIRCLHPEETECVP